MRGRSRGILDAVVDFAFRWYSLLSGWTNQVGQPLQNALSGQNIPAVSAFLLGLLGGLAPCQVSGNAAAIAYVTQASEKERSLFGTVRDYLFGKIAVYMLLGFLAAMLGLELPTPVMAFLRKLTGPLMILMGLYFAGFLRFQLDAGARLTAWLQERMPKRVSPPFWLGVAFSLGFCPTMAMVFFGALTPLVIQAQAGLILPIIFAVGTALPVILWALALAAGRSTAGRWVKGARRLDRWVRVLAAAIFLLIGLNDTILYWLT